MDIFKLEDKMDFETLFKLKTNPFRMTPAISSEDIVWAGFPEVKQKFEERIKRSIKMPNSGLVLNWGEYGSGKTHAARYFSNISNLSRIADSIDSNPPYSLIIVLPKGKNPVYDIFVSIIDKVNIDHLRTIFEDKFEEINNYIDSVCDNLHIRSVLKAFFSDCDSPLLKKYLYGNLSASELRDLNNFGILRNLSTDSDYTKYLSGLFLCLTYKKLYYSTVIIWIDEYEDIAILNSINVDKTNNFIRELLDNTPNNLLLFINLTQSALLTIQDLGQYLSEAIRSRIKERIYFDLPTKAALHLYLEELLNNPLYRTEVVDNKLFPFTNELVDRVIAELNHASVRRYNEAFSILLDLAEMESIAPITEKLFETNKSEIVGWKEE